VQMGLYGAARKNAAAGQPYAGLNAENEALALFSEVDPALHQAVEAGQYGTQAYPSALHYQPQFFLINGEAHPDAKLILSHPANTKETLLLRLLNAGLRSREAMLLGQHMTVVAQDGKTYPYARSQYTTLLPAGGTRDALLKPAAADRYSLMDRAMGTSNGPDLDGGMVAYLDVAFVNGLPVAQADSLTTPQDTAIVDILSKILANDTDSDSDELTAKVTVPPQHGTLTSNNGVTSYTPNSGYVGTDSFTYAANDGTGDSPPAQVSITIRPADEIPVAVNDTYPVDQHQTLGIAAPGVLGNDTPPALAKTAAPKTGPANGTLSLNPNGSFTYTPNDMFSGTDLFTYVASA
ncbi:MAG: tandem-95 repeat protein, partial [Rhodospirillales bacterium]|nr:tandem-95 repeat protein [Rhodospirillales bacterium]